MFKKCGKIMEKHVGQSSALQEIDRWSSCKFSTAGKHSVSFRHALKFYIIKFKHNSRNFLRRHGYQSFYNVCTLCFVDGILSIIYRTK